MQSEKFVRSAEAPENARRVSSASVAVFTSTLAKAVRAQSKPANKIERKRIMWTPLQFDIHLTIVALLQALQPVFIVSLQVRRPAVT